MPAKKSPKPDFTPVFAVLRKVLATQAGKLTISADNATRYTLLSRTPSPFPQHKGQPMWFGEVRAGKAYVSLHLMGLYFNGELTSTISPALKKRMQGKTCFNFKAVPEPALLTELRSLTKASLQAFDQRKWLQPPTKVTTQSDH
jgi:hypothetical protein